MLNLTTYPHQHYFLGRELRIEPKRIYNTFIMYHKCSTTHAVLTHSSPRLTRVSPGLAEAHFDPILPQRCGHNSVDFTTYFLLDIAVLGASGCKAGVICSGSVQIHRVVVCLSADGTPLHPQGVVGHTIELEVRWTAGAYRNTFQHTDLIYIFSDEL